MGTIRLSRLMSTGDIITTPILPGFELDLELYLQIFEMNELLSSQTNLICTCATFFISAHQSQIITKQFAVIILYL